jgi:3-polyprenyl-4-hydroxybenzoate decarboxylase
MAKKVATTNARSLRLAGIILSPCSESTVAELQSLRIKTPLPEESEDWKTEKPQTSLQLDRRVYQSASLQSSMASRSQIMLITCIVVILVSSHSVGFAISGQLLMCSTSVLLKS